MGTCSVGGTGAEAETKDAARPAGRRILRHPGQGWTESLAIACPGRCGRVGGQEARTHLLHISGLVVGARDGALEEAFQAVVRRDDL
jgi:hypothetical protein